MKKTILTNAPSFSSACLSQEGLAKYLWKFGRIKWVRVPGRCFSPVWHERSATRKSSPVLYSGWVYEVLKQNMFWAWAFFVHWHSDSICSFLYGGSLGTLPFPASWSILSLIYRIVSCNLILNYRLSIGNLLPITTHHAPRLIVSGNMAQQSMDNVMRRYDTHQYLVLCSNVQCAAQKVSDQQCQWSLQCILLGRGGRYATPWSACRQNPDNVHAYLWLQTPGLRFNSLYTERLTGYPKCWLLIVPCIIGNWSSLEMVLVGRQVSSVSLH